MKWKELGLMRNRNMSRRKRNLIVKLTREERDAINDGQRRLDESAAVTKMLAEGQRFTWYRLLQKYKITVQYDFDPATGSVYEKERQA